MTIWREDWRARRQFVKASAVSVAELWPALNEPHERTPTVDGMARLLWGSEIQTLLGKRVPRAERAGAGDRSRNGAIF